MKLANLILLFLVIGAFLIYLGGNYNLKNPQSRSSYLLNFAGWIVQLTRNLVHVTMYAIKQPWLPKNVNITKVVDKINTTQIHLNNETISLVNSS